MKKLFYLIAIVLASSTMAQELQTPSTSFSHKKKAYLTLSDGTEIIGNINDIDRKKGIIKAIKVTDGAGEKRKLLPADISYMYLPPSGLDKLGNAINTVNSVQKWKQSKLDEDLLNQGLVYFEQANVKIKKKTMTLLAQLLNPSFSAKVKIYHDPLAKETASLGVGGLKVTGGIAKSYYVQKEGDVAAFKFDKGGYKKEFSYFWNCDALDQQFSSGEEKAWRNLGKHAASYTTDCE
ncbi:hypothetical protein [Ekhidna sp.]